MPRARAPSPTLKHRILRHGRQALVLFETRFWKERGLESWLAASGIPALTGSFHPKLQPALACSHYSHLGTGLSPHGLGSPLLFI